ncbi:HNH endonuclease signature motif containing protein [Cryobacterium sp. PAMC25264]|uniref:HNH endonuclease signature motif containing protein n=1 Tax=Cryobacterium sp. PAMC25264 TaxID=2861288 RepID=UPI001C634F8C|nr:HNH endonuclease signature motif containing protein [Cryobacterium sp. PAMC25264]QYF74776.1 HNH endonuclease [Cryobacterium sp. PAMC25264]
MWRDPAHLPAVQRAQTGVFGEKLQVLAEAAAAVQEVMGSIDVDGLNDAELVALTQMTEKVGRPTDLARVRTATVVDYRARTGLGRDSLAWRLGASHHTDLLTRLTGASGQEMKRRIRLGDKIAPRMMGGTVLDPVFPTVAAALAAGELGLDAAEEIVKGLADYKVHGRFDANPADVDAAEAGLVESATGSVYGRSTDESPITRLGDSDGFSYPADALREMALQWQAALNPDGLAPNEDLLEAKSTFSFGGLRNGLYPLRGGVTPDLKGIIQTLFNTYQSARTAPRFPTADEQESIEAGELVPGEILDDRSGGEKRADILRGILTQIAQDPRTPTMGGMPPTVMVHVSAADLLAGIGVGWIDGIDGPISMKTINQMIDNGGIRPVFFGGNGAVLALGNKARCFSPLQRRAITARDGGCIVPSCTSPAQWTELHHVIPWEHGGRTDIDNGVLLCWYHHHTINTAGWKIRMVNGCPSEAPHWFDPTGTWRRPNQHRAHTPTPENPRTRNDPPGSRHARPPGF